MQTVIDIEENQLNKLLFYTHTKTSTEAINAIIQDYLLKQKQIVQKKITAQYSTTPCQNILESICSVANLITEHNIGIQS